MTTWSIGGEGGNAFSFDKPGDFVVGTVLDLAQVQQTDMDTNKPVFWDNGDPKMMYRVTLQTELRDPADPADDGKRTIYLRGSKKPETQSSLAAVLGAVRAATGGVDLQYGGKLTLQYVSDGPVRQRGFNPPKLYAAWYEAPAMQLDKPPTPTAPTTPVGPPPTAPPPNASGGQAGPAAGWPQPQGPAPAWATGPNPSPQAAAPVSSGRPGPIGGPPAMSPGPSAPSAPAVNTVAGVSASQAGQPTPEQIAGLQALGIDPRSVYPNWMPPTGT